MGNGWHPCVGRRRWKWLLCGVMAATGGLACTVSSAAVADAPASEGIVVLFHLATATAAAK